MPVDTQELPSGSGGPDMAVDIIDGKVYGVSKIVLGAYDTDDGPVASSNPMPVGGTVTANLSAVDNAVLDAIAASVAGTQTVQVTGDALTALQLIDDAVADEGSALGKGVLLQGDDGTDRTNVLVDTAGHFQIDIVSSALPSGAATSANQSTANTTLSSILSALGGTLTVGTHAVTQSGSWTVSLGAVDNAVLDTIAAGYAAEGSALGSGVLLQGDDGTDRTNVLVDTTGHLQIDVVSSALPSGGATAANQSTANSALSGIRTAVEIVDDWDESDRAKVNTIAGQAGVAAGAGAVGANTQRVTLANDDPSISHLASIAGSVSGDGSPTINSYNTVAISASADTANQELVGAQGADTQIWVYGLTGTADTGDGSIALQDADDTALTGVMAVTNGGGFAVAPSGNFAMPWLKVATNKALELDTVTCGFKGVLQYAVVSVA